MKNTLRFALVIALFFSVQSIHAQVSTADSLVQKVFATLKSKDEKAFVALYPNAPQFGRFIRTIMEQAMKSDVVKQAMAADEKSKNMNIDSLINSQVTAVSNPETFGKMQDEFGKSFQKIVEKGEQKGVNWNEAKLTGFTIDSSSMEGMEGVPFKLNGLKEAKGVIDFTVGGSAYQIAYNKMMYIQSEGGWFGAEFTQLARKGESLEPDAPVFSAEDSAAMSMVDTTAAPSEPVKKKTKTKTPTSKTKQVSKTPARKPKTKS